MRKSILKIHLADEEMEMVSRYGCRKVSYMSLSDTDFIKKCDFVIFCDLKGNEILRNMWSLYPLENQVEYTTMWQGGSDGNFPLIAVVCQLYHSIMQFRNERFISDSLFCYKKINFNMAENELQIIKYGLELLKGEISVVDYIRKLNIYSERADACYFDTAAVILSEYPWNYSPNRKSAKAIEKICVAWDEMKVCLGNSKRWNDLHKIAYKIHNEPGVILLEGRYQK